MIIRFCINGRDTELDVRSDERAVDILRERLGLTGTKEGCGTGECGACAILVNGRARLSCLTLAAQLDGQDLTTIEGLGSPKTPHALQRSFAEHGAVQCGFCTPGMVVAAADLLARDPHPERETIREALSGNLCRCTGYTRILDAVHKVEKP
ncbi:carbon-monoxide dehydrogenase small subunit [Desulfomicrobium apsheronum]|uniref:Carbon-monoxide dehydrogenase small subunit n=1 Tax=Desulfomicrobium apsheronum TaxID=52560 RepID=A0A1I3T4X9_9BACT|nr:(2Fe-2S)-binding protein [Desulfomicrobium apsheronum]SFJ66198.1 carbon-monoxide dehydrogenase small subunit [Desulfomicrobium apsheronum]